MKELRGKGLIDAFKKSKKQLRGNEGLRDYYRRKAKENHRIDKKLRPRYHTAEANPGETYSQFKKRMKKNSLI